MNRPNMPVTTITEDDFCAIYDPEPENEHGDLYVQRYFSEATDEPLLMKAWKERRLWTVVTGDDNRTEYIVSGYHFVNRHYYIITRNPYPADTEVEVPWFDDDEAEESTGNAP
jgi:hypothetical protein